MMAQAIPLYQIGGFRAHTSDQPDSLAESLSLHKEGIELTLGVLPSGATYLLLEEDRFFRIFRRSRYNPWYSDEFRSLSPVNFSSRGALENKLDSYVSNKKTKSGAPRDRSKANTGYTIHAIQSLTDLGCNRADFELQRVYYRLCRDQLPRRRVYDFPSALLSRLQSMRLVAFTFNLWRMDRRLTTERIEKPKILDLGWTEFVLPGVSTNLQVKSSLHWIVRDNSMLNNPGSKPQDFKHGRSETLPQNELSLHLQKLFSEVSPNVMLLVHDKVTTHQVLKSLGIDIFSWQVGLYNILRSPRSPRPSGSSSRRRSRSPDRKASRDPRQRPSQTPSEPSTGFGTEPIGVDIQQLFSTLKQVPPGTSIGSAARHLQLTGAPSEDSRDWCAGNESVLLGNMWEAMASGNAIDDQRLMRWPSTPHQVALVGAVKEDVKPSASSLVEEPASEAAPSADNDSDSDFDPNDVAPAGAQGGLVMKGQELPSLPSIPGGSIHHDPYEELDDDDEF